MSGDATIGKEHQRSPANPQELEESPGTDLPLNPREKLMPSTSWSLTSMCQSISAVTQSVVPCYHSPSVTESRLVLLTTRQAKNQETICWGQGIAILFGKTAVREHGRLVSQRTIFPEPESSLLLRLGKGCGWLVQTLVQESFVLGAVHIGQVIMFL